MAGDNSNPLVDGARALLAEAEEIVGRGADAAHGVRSPDLGAGGASGVLDLYERLTKRLAAVDDDKISGLVGSIGKRVEDLESLARDMDRLARVKRNLSDL